MRAANVAKRLIHLGVLTKKSNDAWGQNAISTSVSTIACYCYYGETNRRHVAAIEAEQRWTVLCGAEDGSSVSEGDTITNITRTNPLTGEADIIHPGGRVEKRIVIDHRLEGAQLYQFKLAPN